MKIKNWKLKIAFVVIFIVGFLLFAVNLVNAAELKLFSSVQEIALGRQFQIDLLLDAEGESINAVEGKIVFPDTLELKEIIDGDSIINFWLEQPLGVHSCSVSCQLAFSGIIPGGFEGVLSPYWSGLRPGKVFSLVFEAQGAGSAVIEIQNAKSLLNDGKGTEAELRIMNYKLRIKNRELATTDKEPSNSSFLISNSDSEPPETIQLETANDPNIFDGQWFLAFAARDNGSGIDHYELQENRKREIEAKRWRKAESPYLLEDQSLQSYIYIRAVDKTGNERIEMVEPRYPYMRLWYEKYWVWAIIGGIITVAVFIYREFRI